MLCGLNLISLMCKKINIQQGETAGFKIAILGIEGSLRMDI